MNVETVDENVIDLCLQELALKLARQRELWVSNKERLLPVVNAARKAGADVKIDEHGLDFRKAGDKHDLATMFRILRTSGFDTTSARPEKGAVSWNGFFEARDCSMRIWFMFTATVCRRVQVGTRMVEQPVYETVCDGLELPPADEKEPAGELEFA